jgi:plastocyanin
MSHSVVAKTTTTKKYAVRHTGLTGAERRSLARIIRLKSTSEEDRAAARLRLASNTKQNHQIRVYEKQYVFEPDFIKITAPKPPITEINV